MAAPAVSPALPQALTAALDDELRARATYQAVIAAHGPVAPFAAIVGAEERHIAALVPLFARYGVPLPPDRWSGQVPAPPTLVQACEAGAAAEVANYRMYDALLAQVGEADVRAVFIRLRNASAYHHLPAFQACAAAERAGPGPVPAARAGAAPAPPAASGGAALWFGLAAGAGLVWWLSGARRGR